MANPINTLGYIKCCTSSSPDLLKALTILLDLTVGRSIVDVEDLKPYWKSEKRSHFLKQSTILLFTSFSRTLLTTETRLTRWWFVAVDLFPTLLNKVTAEETFQQSAKHDSFRDILKSSASIYESYSQFFRNTTEIQSGPDAFDESSFIMIFLTIVGVTEILYSD